jgi:NADH-quinone oxidoreductase subunit N
MTSQQLLACSPLIAIALAVVVELLLVSFHRGARAAAAVAAIGLVLAGALLAAANARTSTAITALLVIDRYALFYIALVLVAGLGTIALAYRYFSSVGDLYVLVLLGTLGAAVLAASVHFASFFLGLELLSVSLYSLISYRAERRGIEAGLKYLVLAAVSAAFLLFGMALIYAELGTLEFDRMAGLVHAGAYPPAIWWIGLALIVTGVGFKLALVPFHLWTPDVYQGAPAPVAGFVATASKTAVLAVLSRFVTEIHGATLPPLVLVLSLVAGLSMFFGNLLALLQSNVKRILGYSSIAHLGYLLVALTAGGELAIEAVGFYLATYVITMLAAFGVVAVLSAGREEAERLDAYRGLFWRRPRLAAVLTAALSLTSIPITGGFVGKLYIVGAGAASSRWTLLVILAVTSAIGLFYYLRIIVAMYSKPVDASADGARVPLASAVALAALLVLLLWLGLYPAPIVEALRSTHSALPTASTAVLPRHTDVTTGTTGEVTRAPQDDASTKVR